MKLKQLEYVLWVDRLGSFTKAAAKLRVAQPAISRQIKILEKELGARLFHRDGHGAIPTSAARILSNTAEGIFKQLEETKAELNDMKESPVGEVCLGVPPSLSQYFAKSLNGIVKSRYPDISLKITEGWTGYLYDRIVGGQIDLGIIYSSQATKHLDWEFLLTEDVSVITATTHNLDLKEYSLAQVARLPLVVPPRPHGLRLVIDKVFSKHGLTPNIVFETEVWNVLKEFVEHDEVYVLLPPSELREEIAAGRFHAKPIVKPGIKRTLCIARSRQKRTTRAVEKVLRLIVDETKHHVLDGALDH
jgi:LysR family nitrogen assimilation transcriptional regulator